MIPEAREALERIAPLWLEQPHLRIVTNAGGVNPKGCAQACAEIMRKAGLGGRKIALVIMPG
ncbi:MAG: acyclic terpene utilization AtuA family protein [Candidatus Eisenbacteria sp.]|nr:acyclic terpene utilization AtuA family protein [Candidatus Eisenbacteria bacterium]